VNKKTFFAILGLLAFLCVLCSNLGILCTAPNGGVGASAPSSPASSGRPKRELSAVIRDDDPNRSET
jgi:hypothetical protein